MKVTLKDVAKKAGVTEATVSLVLHNNTRISEKTKQKVLKSVMELDYYPNSSARSLALGRTDRIAVVTHDFPSFYILNVLQGLTLAENYGQFNLDYFKKSLVNLISSLN